MGWNSKSSWLVFHHGYLHEKSAPFRLDNFMYCKQLNNIISALWYTNMEVPYKNEFIFIQKLEEFWNENMAKQFLPSWINIHDKWMIEWFNKWDPVLMCVRRKHHPFVNEGHTTTCNPTTILWRAYIMEGKYIPTQMGAKKWSDLGNTAGIMLKIYCWGKVHTNSNGSKRNGLIWVRNWVWC